MRPRIGRTRCKNVCGVIGIVGRYSRTANEISCVATTDKVNLVPGMEDGAPKALHLARGDVERLPVVDTPAGKLATLICYDGFHTPHTTLERFVPELLDVWLLALMGKR